MCLMLPLQFFCNKLTMSLLSNRLNVFYTECGRL